MSEAEESREKQIKEKREEFRSNLLEVVYLGNNIIKKLDEGPIPAKGGGTIHRGLADEGKEYVKKEPTDDIEACIKDKDGQFYKIKLSIMPIPSTELPSPRF